MTRDEFISDVLTFGELITFCIDEGIDNFINHIYDMDSMTEYIDDELYEFINENGWECVRDTLSYIPTEFNYVKRTGWIEFVGLDDEDFDEIKENVVGYMDRFDLWDSLEDDESDIDDQTEEEEFEEINEEELSALFIQCRECCIKS